MSMSGRRCKNDAASCVIVDQRYFSSLERRFLQRRRPQRARECVALRTPQRRSDYKITIAVVLFVAFGIINLLDLRSSHGISRVIHGKFAK